VKDCLIKLELFAPNQFHTHWWMVCDDPAQLNVPGFSVFLRSLEKLSQGSLNASDCVPLDAAKNTHADIEKLNKLID